MKWDRDYIRVQEKMAEYALAASRLFKGKTIYLNYVLQVSKDCDCMSRTDEVVAEDIGIFGSLDPVAVDRASVDRLLSGSGRDVLREANDVDWRIQLNHAEKIGLGRQSYDLIELESD